MLDDNKMTFFRTLTWPMGMERPRGFLSFEATCTTDVEVTTKSNKLPNDRLNKKELYDSDFA